MGRLKEAMLKEQMMKEFMTYNEPRTITVLIKTIYGQDKIYPYCNDAKTFCKLLGQTTLTRENIRYIKDLGYTLTQAQEEFKL